jgi:hypothetical protein
LVLPLAISASLLLAGTTFPGTPPGIAQSERSPPADARGVTCRIARADDLGQSWGPGLALVWPDGKALLANIRKEGACSVIANGEEQLVANPFQHVPDYDLAASRFTGQAVVALRNPDDAPKSIPIEAGAIFELPVGAPTSYALTSAYKDQRVQSLDLKVGNPVTIELQPFEVLVFDSGK